MSEKVTVKVERSVLHLPAIALRGLVVFPNNLLHFEVGREKSIAAVEWAVSNNSDVFLVAQKEMKVEDPKAADLYTYGVVAEVKQVMRVSDDLVRILVEGKYRARLSEMEDDGSFLLATVRPAPVKMAKPEELPEADVLVRNVKKSFDDLLNQQWRPDKHFTYCAKTPPGYPFDRDANLIALPPGDYFCCSFRLRHLEELNVPLLRGFFEGRQPPAFVIANEYEDNLTDFRYCPYELQFFLREA